MPRRKSAYIITDKGLGVFLRRAVKKAYSLVLRTNNAVWYRLDLTGAPVPSETGEVKVVFSPGGEIIQWIREKSVGYPWIYIEEELETAGRENHIFPFAVI